MEPDFEEQPAFRVAGLQVRVRPGVTDLPGLWRDLSLRSAELASANPGRAYGVSHGFLPASGTFDYLAGYAVDPGAELPPGFTYIDIPAQRYAVFATTLPSLMDTLDQANHVWLPASSFVRAGGPEFELYDSDFDPANPQSQFRIYLPIQPGTRV